MRTPQRQRIIIEERARMLLTPRQRGLLAFTPYGDMLAVAGSRRRAATPRACQRRRRLPLLSRHCLLFARSAPTAARASEERCALLIGAFAICATRTAKAPRAPYIDGDMRKMPYAAIRQRRCATLRTYHIDTPCCARRKMSAAVTPRLLRRDARARCAMRCRRCSYMPPRCRALWRSIAA